MILAYLSSCWTSKGVESRPPFTALKGGNFEKEKKEEI